MCKRAKMYIGYIDKEVYGCAFMWTFAKIMYLVSLYIFYMNAKYILVKYKLINNQMNRETYLYVCMHVYICYM